MKQINFEILALVLIHQGTMPRFIRPKIRFLRKLFQAFYREINLLLDMIL